MPPSAKLVAARVAEVMSTPTLLEAEKSFNSLFKQLEEEQAGTKNPMHYSTRGVLASAHFFNKHRAEVAVSRRYTGERAKSFVADEGAWQKCCAASAKWAAQSSDGVHKRNDTAGLKRRALADMHGKANQFPPYVAAALLRDAKAVHVLDPFAGWGDRLVGAAVAPGVASYTGIDANAHLKEPYAKMQQILPSQGFRAKVITGKPAEAVNYSKFKYDTVLTSPPYYLREQYMDMPEYSSYEDFMDRALVTTFKKVFANLDSGGTMMVVLPETMGQELFQRLGLKAQVASFAKAGTKSHVSAAAKHTVDGKTHTEKGFTVRKPGRKRRNCIA